MGSREKLDGLKLLWTFLERRLAPSVAALFRHCASSRHASLAVRRLPLRRLMLVRHEPADLPDELVAGEGPLLEDPADVALQAGTVLGREVLGRDHHDRDVARGVVPAQLRDEL